MKTPARVALVIDYSLQYLGGAQSAFLDEARVLHDRGHDVLIVAPTSPHRDSDSAFSPLVNIAYFPVTARVTIPVVELPLIRNTEKLRDTLRAEFERRNIDVVHVHSEFGLAAAAVSAAKSLGLVTAQTVHTFFWQASVAKGLGGISAAAVRLFARWLRAFPSSRQQLAENPVDSALRGVTLSLAQRVNVVVSPSAHQADRLREAGLRNVCVIPNSVSLADAAGAVLTSVSRPLRLVWVGRLVSEKRLLEWIEAVKIATSQLPPNSLYVEIIGSGPLEAEARAYAEDAPIHFLGRLSREDVQRHMADAHLVALTSFGFDNQPVTVVEAMHARRGVVYADPALREGLDAAGLLAEGPEPDAVAALLVKLAENSSLVLEASAKTLEGAKEFDPDQHHVKLIEAYGS